MKAGIQSGSHASIAAGRYDTHGVRYLDRDTASSNLRHFCKVLNKAVFGNAAHRYGKRIRLIPVLEGSRDTRLHYHLAVDRPAHIPLDRFKKLIETSWRATDWGHDQISIAPNADSGWIGYLTKFRTKSDFADSIDWLNYHNP